MGGLFSGPPAPPKIQEPVPPPQVDSAAVQADERHKLAARAGRMSTLFTSTTGAPLTGQTRTSTLLGQPLGPSA